MKMAKYGLFSKDALEPLMVVIYISPPLLLSKISIGIKKASFHRIASSYAILTCSSHTLFQAGKVPQQMLGFGLMHWQKDFIILQMDILTTRNFLFLFVVFGIIFRSGVLQAFGMYFLFFFFFFFLMDLIFVKIIQQPNECK